MKRNIQWYYRGSLKSCNYSCSYCPFCKRNGSPREEEKDRAQLFQFIDWMEKRKALTGAVQLTPYGEALIHPYYWEGLARLSRHPGLEAVGAQSNFSFPVEKMLEHYLKHGGKPEKLRLWGTFHPEMTSAEQFASQCQKLLEFQISFCTGAVGVPAQLPEIQKLREHLDSSIYLWINKMDGLSRSYTEEEIERFLEIDEFFALELKRHPADSSLCGNQIFVEADGSLRRCNLCRTAGKNLYEPMAEQELRSAAGKWNDCENLYELTAENAANKNDFEAFISEQLICTRRECSCYLAYNNRMESDMRLFLPYPAFRIPVYPKAVFLDIDGTIIPKGEKKLSEHMKRRLLKLSEHSDIYLATSLPMEEALRRVRGIGHALAGGVFASGGRWVIFEHAGKKACDFAAPLETDWLEEARKKQKAYGFRIHTCHKDGQIYKVTLTFPARRLETFWEEFAKKSFADGDQPVKTFQNMGEKGMEKFAEVLQIPDTCRVFQEENCIQIVQRDRGKLEGMLEIMELAGYRRDEVMAFGDSREDEAMVEYTL